MGYVPNEREAVQRDDGSFMCLQCKGDWYACDCPRECSKPRNKEQTNGNQA